MLDCDLSSGEIFNSCTYFDGILLCTREFLCPQNSRIALSVICDTMLKPKELRDFTTPSTNCEHFLILISQHRSNLDQIM